MCELGGALVEQSEDFKKTLNHVTVATEETMTAFAVALRTAKDSLRRSERTCADHELTIAELQVCVCVRVRVCACV